MGHVIADYCDYAIAYQLINNSFMESLGEGQRYTNDRIKIIEKHGMISSKDLAKVTGVSVAAISQWMKTWIEKRVLIWCDETGQEFTEENLLEKAKRSGKALIKVDVSNRLPTPFELTGDERWDADGDFYQLFDLKLGDVPVNSETLSDVVEEPSVSIELSENDFDGVKIFDSEDNSKGVKVLNEKVRGKNKIEKIKRRSPEHEDKAVAEKLFKEFETILYDEKSDCMNPPPDTAADTQSDLIKPKNNIHVDGLLTI